MPSASFTRFYCFLEDLAKGVHNLLAANDVLTVYLTNNTPDEASDYVKADLAGITEQNGYAPADIANDFSQTTGVITVTAEDVVFTATGGSFGPFRYAVIYNETATDDPLVAFFDYGSSITVLEGESFTVDFGDSLMVIGAT